MSTLSSTIVLIVLVLCIAENYAHPQSRIVNGTAGDISQAPFLVNIQRNGEVLCSGTLVSNLHVATAAHCVRPYTVDQLQVVGGETYISEQGVRRAVAKRIFPAAYNATSRDYDVAVLKLASEMVGTNIQPIALCQNPGWKKGDLIRIYGWGLLAQDNYVAPDGFRVTDVPLWSKQDCVAAYQGQRNITHAMMCAGNGVNDACRGDDGGPAIFKNQLCGIISFGLGCAVATPTVYTNVNIVRPFIENAMTL